MKLTANEFKASFQQFVEVIENEKDYLCELDRKLGDGDHGVTMSIGWQAVNEKLNNELADETDCGKISSTIAMTFLNAVGSSVGPLYATGFLRGSKAVAQKSELTDEDLTNFWIAFINGVKERGQSKVGDKTMIDTLEPALLALEANFAETQDFVTSFEKAVEAGEEGMKSTIDMVSKLGRSSRLGERSKGAQDPGATSAYLLLDTFHTCVKQHQS
ncbi:dihydroxyacetone kinase subunit DhaL [Pullulanibacillus sp. KACC 23026]|uniref:dihydroxyacetone kinase subunit DhaL n=1 Tax=Pullulanibacillus sp. KACC 23026 TaxID=3028315 RepID=UPI0023AFDF8D|nr:dihydroxyacetone kinase subunit DhaL [Pullulanibacillus sp. KACC 23026]WEG12454.1 dihydroxyacetone kinase subunit DhaL [Pullulanibacillus sp. KACC 23026]